MTEQEHLAIRVALARLRGVTIEKRWQHVNDPTWCIYDIRLPGGTYLGSHCGSIEEAASKLPDPFTSAAANRELVKWLAADDERWARFDNSLLDCLLEAAEPIKVISKQNNWLSTHQQWERLKLTAPLKTITLAAARALKIIE